MKEIAFDAAAFRAVVEQRDFAERQVVELRGRLAMCATEAVAAYKARLAEQVRALPSSTEPFEISRRAVLDLIEMASEGTDRWAAVR